MSGRESFLNSRKTAAHLCLLVILSICLFAAGAQSQDKKEAQKGQDEVLTLKSHLVTTDIIVKDKKGRFVTDLKAEDFTVLENGVRQTIEFFEPPLAGSRQPAGPNAVTQAPAINSGASPMNIISLVVDGTTTGLADMAQVRKGLIKYIEEQTGDTDTIAIFAVSSGLQLLQPFTQDKAKLISAVERAYSSTTLSKNLERADIAREIARLQEELRNVEGNPTPQAMLQATMSRRALERFTLLRGQLSQQTARPLLAALAAICDALHTIPGKKSLVLFSQGATTSAMLDWQVQATIDIANRANVAIYIIDSAGLTANAPRSGAYVPSSPLGGVAASGRAEDRIRAVGGENVFDNVRHEGVNREQDILYRISGDTGGEFIKGSNDLTKGLTRIDEIIEARYTLAYYSSDQNFDGSFRKIKVEARRPDLRVATRPGYYATGSDEIVFFSAEEKRLLAGFATAEASPAFPFFMELSPFKREEGRYWVPLSIEVPPGAIKFDQKANRYQIHLEFLGVIREKPDKIISRIGGNFNIALTAEQYRSILANMIFYRQDIELTQGSYDIDLIIRDRLSGKVAAKKETLVLSSSEGELSTSGLVLSRQVEPVLNTTVSTGQATSDDPLRHEGVLIRPLPGRVFRPGDNLIIYFELYNVALSPETRKPKVKVTVSLMKDGKPAIKPIEYLITDIASEQASRVTFAKFISLTGIGAGKYAAMIEARDMVTGKVLSQEARFAIAQ